MMGSICSKHKLNFFLLPFWKRSRLLVIERVLAFYLILGASLTNTNINLFRLMFVNKLMRANFIQRGGGGGGGDSSNSLPGDLFSNCQFVSYTKLSKILYKYISSHLNHL